MERWSPPVEASPYEERLLKRLTRVRALFGFLRRHRHELFDAAFQEQLEGMYRTTGAGDEPNPPALLCMAVLLQGYVGASDAEAVELALVDLRWQMVLGCLGATTPPFSQGGLQAFRERMIAHEMDRVLLDRTVALVRSGAMTEGEGRAVSKALRAAIDSRPLAGAGKVEDTINLLGHAARCIVQLVSKLTERDPDEICRKAGIPLLLAPSIKAGLDLDWSDPKQKAIAVQIVEQQVSSLQRWVERHLDDVMTEPLGPYIEALGQVRAQDLEVGPERRDAYPRRCRTRPPYLGVRPQMRHGRKSRSKRFDGYKEHIARDLDFPAIVACAVTPANRPEEVGRRAHRGGHRAAAATTRGAPYRPRLRQQPRRRRCVRVGRNRVRQTLGALRNRPGLFTKGDFKIDLRAKTITCPAGEVEPFEPGETVEFDPEACGACPLRSKCTQAASGNGRTVSIAADEARQRKFRKLQQTARARRASTPHRRRTRTRAHRCPQGTSRSIRRRPTQSLRPATGRRHPEPREYPSLGPCRLTTQIHSEVFMFGALGRSRRTG